MGGREDRAQVPLLHTPPDSAQLGRPPPRTPSPLRALRPLKPLHRGHQVDSVSSTTAADTPPAPPLQGVSRKPVPRARTPGPALGHPHSEGPWSQAPQGGPGWGAPGAPMAPTEGCSPCTPAPSARLAGEGSSAHLVNLVPAVLVLAAHGRALVEQQLAAAGVAPDHRRVVQRGQAVAVLVIRGRAKLQEGLRKKCTDVRSLVSWPPLQE